MLYIGRLGQAGLKKESVVGTLATPPDRYRRFHLPFNFSTDIALLIGKGVQGLADEVLRTAQGPGQLKGGKMKYELDLLEVGDDLMAAFGTDTMTETASFTVVGHTIFTVTALANDSIDFKEGIGVEKTATLTPGDYTAYEFCAEVKTQMESANGTAVTYTVTFSKTTKKFTITPSASTIDLLWNSGTNNAKAADTLMGFAADILASAAATSPVAVTFDANANDSIDFTEGAGTEKHAYLTAGTYAMGADSGVASSLCKLVKDIMEAANGTADAYTVTYSYTTKKLTAVNGTEVFVFKWTTGVNAATAAMSLLGFTADSASATTAVSDSTTAAFVMSHAFSRIASAELPSYSWWQKTGLDYPQHLGCMLTKLELSAKAKEFVEMDAEWLGLAYDANGVTQTATFSSLNPCKFSMCALTIGGSLSANYDDVKITIANSVAVEHSVSATIWGTKIYSKGFKVDVSLSLIVEDLAEWAKFIAGTDTSLSLVITSPDLIKAGFPYKLTLSIPKIAYSAAPRQLPNGLIKIVFTGHAKNTDASYAMLPTLVTSYGAAY